MEYDHLLKIMLRGNIHWQIKGKIFIIYYKKGRKGIFFFLYTMSLFFYFGKNTQTLTYIDVGIYTSTGKMY